MLRLKTCTVRLPPSTSISLAKLSHFEDQSRGTKASQHRMLYTRITYCERRSCYSSFPVNISVLSPIVSFVVVDVIPRDRAPSTSHGTALMDVGCGDRRGERRQLTAITMKSVEKTSDPHHQAQKLIARWQRDCRHLERTPRENTVRRARNREAGLDITKTKSMRGTEGNVKAREYRTDTNLVERVELNKLSGTCRHEDGRPNNHSAATTRRKAVN